MYILHHLNQTKDNQWYEINKVIGATMKAGKKLEKRLYKVIQEMDLPQFMWGELELHPHKLESCVRQGIRDRDRVRFDRTHGTTTDRKTPLGFLYSAFNNMKSRYKLSDARKRNDFILKFLNSKKFYKIFSAYIDSDFNFFMKPKFEHGDNIEDIKLIKKGYKILHIRREDIKTLEYTYWGSLNSAAKEIKIATSSVSGAIKDGRILKGRYKFKYVEKKRDRVSYTHRDFVAEDKQDELDMKKKETL